MVFMLISRNLMLSVIVFVVVVFVAVLIYLFVRSAITNKRVRDAERAHETLFLAKVQAQRREKELADKGLTRGAIVYKPDTHISDYAQRPFSLGREPASAAPSVPEDVPVIPEEPPVTRKLSEFFD